MPEAAPDCDVEGAAAGAPEAAGDLRRAQRARRRAIGAEGRASQGRVDVRSIIKKADALPEVEKVALGPDFDDEEEVPPLQ